MKNNSEKGLVKWLHKSFPQNYILKKPVAGSLIFLVIIYLFSLFYRPFGIHPSRSFNLAVTMAIYCTASSLPVLIITLLFKKTRYFGHPHEWNIIREFIAAVIILASFGIGLYFMGFLMEPPENRWNLATFLSSCSYGFLFGILPYGFFSALNYRHLSLKDQERYFPVPAPGSLQKEEKPLRIQSLLKKEDYHVIPNHILYIESDSNYVLFHILVNGKVKKSTLRNSIASIEEQLSGYPFLMRTHRAFIVNLNHVVTQKGNSLGYRLKLEGIDTNVPVSRQNTREFDERMKCRS